jgi:hypothetical protein
MTDDVPLLAEEVLGYRAWRLGDDGQLMSYVAVHPDARTVWAPGVVVARCRHGHDAPHVGCGCGLHAGYEPPNACRDGGFGHNHAVYGAIIAWGAIDTTSTDFRAQYARIVCVAFWRMQTWHHTELIRAVARRHGVRCVELDELAVVAREYASEIPLQLRGRSPVHPPAS